MRILTPIHTEFEPTLQTVEVSSSFQIPSLQIVGLPSQEVSEAKERVRSAIEASEFEFPKRRLIVNLSPAHIRKRGTGADLAIALAILSQASASNSPAGHERPICAVGELGLQGDLKAAGKPTRTVVACLEAGIEFLLVPATELAAAQAARELVRQSGRFPGRHLVIHAPRTLAEAWKTLSEPAAENEIPVSTGGIDAADPAPNEADREPPDSQQIPPSLGRSLLIAAGGGHHLLLVGPKGTGKSTAAEFLSSLLPEPAPRSRLEILLTHELGGAAKPPTGLPTIRVPASTHRTGLTGNQAYGAYQPGAFALADQGILIADELPEWPRDSREALREPLERRRISLRRLKTQVEVPTRFLLVGTANLCPCGEFSPTQSLSPCRCRPRERAVYLSRLSGPVMDRIDLVSLIDTPTQSHFSWPTLGSLRAQVRRAREAAHSQLGELPATLPPAQLEARLPGFDQALDRLGTRFSLRGRHKLARVALTLALLEDCAEPADRHYFEASLFRPERWLSSPAYLSA